MVTIKIRIADLLYKEQYFPLLNILDNLLHRPNFRKRKRRVMVSCILIDAFVS